MGFFDKVSSMLRPEQDYDDEGYYLDDDYMDDEDDYGYDDEPKINLFGRSKSSDSSEKPAARTGGLFGRRSDVISVAPSSMQVTMKKPRSVNDFQDICDDLLDGKPVVINLEGVNSDVAQRIIDFTFGAVYSISGDLKVISKFIFMASPSNIELAGEFGNDAGLDTMTSGSSASRSYGDGRSELRRSGIFG